MTATERAVCDSQFLRRVLHQAPQSHTGKPQVGWEAEGAVENMNKDFNCGFRRKDWVRQGKQTWDWLELTISVGSGCMAVPCCLVPGPGVTRAEG